MNNAEGVFFPVPRRLRPPVPLRTTPEARYWASFRKEEYLAARAEAAARSNSDDDADNDDDDDDDLDDGDNDRENDEPRIKATPSYRPAVTHLEFSPHGTDLAVTAGTQVRVVPPRLLAKRKTISRFKDVAYSASYKRDGKLLVAGGEAAEVKIFDLSSRLVLRTFRGHTGSVRTTRFATHSNVHVFSGSDDQTVRLWDVPTNSCTATFTSHQDYVRAQCGFTSMSHLWASGSYDRSVHLHDIRENPSKKPVVVLDHGEPVDALLPLPGSGTLMMSVGGSEVRVWDLLGGGRSPEPVRRMRHVHGKAVNCAASGVDKQGNPVVLTGGLDGRVKIHTVDTWEVVQSLNAGGQVLSVGLSGDGSRLAIGTSCGLLDIRVRPKDILDPEEEFVLGDNAPFTPAFAQEDDDEEELNIETMKFGIPRPRRGPTGPRPGSLRFFLRGPTEKAAPGDIVAGGVSRRRRKLRDHDKYLRQFEYGAALDAALDTGEADVIMSVIEDLVFREAFARAVLGGGADRLERVLNFIHKHVSDPRHVELLLEVSCLLLDGSRVEYGEPQSSAVCESLRMLNRRVREEVELQKQLYPIVGITDMALAMDRSRRE